MQLARRHGIWLSILLGIWLGCGEEAQDPDPLPPATVVSVKPIGRPGSGWGRELHVTFSRDPGPVWIEDDEGRGSGEELVGSGTLRAFLALPYPLYLAWGDGQTYDVGLPEPHYDDFGPLLMGVAPDIDHLAFSVDFMNATDITVTFTAPISPPGDDDPERMLQLWEVKYVEFENLTTGETWTPEHTVRGHDVTVLRTEARPYVPASSYMLRGGIGTVFGDYTYTLLELEFATE